VLLGLPALGGSPAAAAIRRSPTLAPANTVVDGPDPNILSLDGLSVARDGTGGLVYLKEVGGVAHVFVSRLLAGAFQTPAQVDSGLVGPSSQPVIAADPAGLLLIAFINAGQLYVVQAANALSPLSAPAGLFAAASNPALSLSNFGKGYLVLTAPGAGGNDVRAAYYDQGQWAIEPTPLDAVASDDAGTGTGRPQVAASGDGIAIAVWGENGHVYSRRLSGTTPSVVYEQADVPTLDGWNEVSAGDPVVSTGGDSSYAEVAFDEVIGSGTAQQSRVLMTRLHGSQYDRVVEGDGVITAGPEGAAQPAVAVTEYGAGFVTSEHDQTHSLFATTLGANEASGATTQVDSLANTAAPDAVPATAGLFSTFIAWQENPGSSGPPEIRVRYAPDGSDLGPEEVISSPGLGATDADNGLAAAGDIAGDAVIAWVQGTGAGTQIVAGQLYQAPGGFVPLQTFRYAISANPVLSWSPASELWGAPDYIVKLDGVQIAETQATAIRAPAAVANGPHTWQVTAVNHVGLSTSARTATVFVDTVPPRVSLTITGVRTVKSILRAAVTYTDAPPPLPPADASGIRSVQVRWGDGAKSSISHIKDHAYRRPGTYTVTVIATDRAGHRTTVVREVKIKPKPKPKPKPKRHKKKVKKR
jgi:PKD domain